MVEQTQAARNLALAGLSVGSASGKTLWLAERRWSFGPCQVSVKMAVECPWCEYEGLVASVEGHISSSTDDAHRGKVGKDLHQHLPQTGDSGAESDVSPALALVVASVLVAAVVLGGSEEPAEEIETDVADPEGWQ